MIKFKMIKKRLEIDFQLGNFTKNQKDFNARRTVFQCYLGEILHF